MKHLFLVHSPVTYLTSVAVIKEQRLSKEDAVIIFIEFEKLTQKNEQYTGVSLNEFFTNKTFLKKFYNYFRYFNISTRIDKLVDSTIKQEKFIAYIPVLLLASKALITHPNCCTFNFIEEGLANYYREETLNSLAAINSRDPWRSSVFKNMKTIFNEMYLVLRGYNFKLQALPFSYSCYNSFNNVKFFGLSQNSFPLIDERKKIVVSFEKKDFVSIKQPHDFILDNKIIWIGDGGVFHHGFSEALYLQGIKKGCIDFIKEKKQRNIFIKFHRDEPGYLRKKVQKLFEDNEISFEVIPDSVIMELLLFDAKNVMLIGVYSSLLYYASIMGHQSFSVYEFLKKEYSKIIASRDFNFYWNKVKRIENTAAIKEEL
ncbi:MAG: hypothetical protein ACR2FN_13130 [Chitinophagaceae bacterium]